VQDGHRHPVSHYNQLVSPIPIVVDPGGIGYHAQVFQFRRQLDRVQEGQTHDGLNDAQHGDDESGDQVEHEQPFEVLVGID